VANIKSAEKRWRQSLKRRLRNRAVRTATRTHIKTVNRSIGAGEPNETALKQAIRALDKAAEKGIIHRNNAARRKSRLMHRFAMALSPQGAPVAAQPARTTRRRTTAATSRARRRTS
jgi:small subunit ribosomal protein S20